MNPASLQSRLRELREQVAGLQEALEQSRRENALLRQKLDALARRFFGKKSEQLNAAQLELLLSGLAEGSVELSEEKEPPARPAPRPARTHTRRIRTPDNLEVVREVIEPDLVKAEPEHWKRIGQEVSRQLDYQPGKFFWQETVRPKYVRRHQRALPPVTAAAPERVAEHSLAAPGLLAQLLVSKYCDHLPFYRQEQIFWQRHGVFLARQQMVQWTAQSVRLLSGISDCLKREMRRSPYVQVDETPVRYQDPNLRGRCGQGYLWTALVPGQCVVYEWHTSRAARCLDSLLGPGFAGKLQCDGYSAYPAFARGKSAVNLLGCWAHARRNFFEAQEQAPRVAGWFLNQIGLLYRWEEQLRRNRAGPVLRQVQRSSHHRMVLERLGRALKKLQPRYLPQSLMGQAIGYALNQWPMLEGFLEHGEVEIDNNLVENVTQSFGLRSLCRAADNAEKLLLKAHTPKLNLQGKVLPLGIIADWLN
ncbi:MAG TPA: IS66 family transposase [Verrucomicrobiota bacterium]|nr:IS66 family transposase [Verrucomicrobiota bacterium]HQL79110.1 IS66 family transposase [Verrucomicrobiota bacterium]